MFYIVYKKNLHLCPSKIAYETIKLTQQVNLSSKDQLIVLGISSAKFRAVLKKHSTTVRYNQTLRTETCALVESDEPITF